MDLGGGDIGLPPDISIQEATNIGPNLKDVAAMGQVLAMATRETELHKLLADERLRSEQHKLNYQTLKVEHQRLQEEFGHLETQMSHILDEKRHLQEMNMEALQKSQKELQQTKTFIEELKGQLLTPQRAELLRLQHEEEFQKKYMDALHKMEEETERYRSECEKLRFENTVIRTEYEHEKLESERQLEAARLQYENKILRLKKENEAFRSKTICGQGQSADLVKNLQKEKLQLVRQLEGVKQELKDAKDELIKTENRSEDTHRQLNRQVLELSARVKSLELEKSSGLEQYQHLQQKLQEQSDQTSENKLHLSESVMKSSQLKLQLEDVERRAKLEIASLHEDLARQKVEYETHIERLQQHIKGLKLELDTVTKSSKEHCRQRVEKEQEVIRRLHTAHEADLEKLNALRTEKLAIDARCQEIEKRLVEVNDQKREEVSKLKNKLTVANENKTGLEKEMLMLRMKLDRHEHLAQQLEKKQLEIQDLQSQVGKLKGDVQAMEEAETQLVAQNKELDNTIEAARREIESLRSKDNQKSVENEILLHRQEMKWDTERQELLKKISKFEHNVKSLKRQSQSSVWKYKQKIGKYGKLITKLRNRLELQDAKIQELDIEKEVLKKSVPNEVHNTVKKQLHDLQRRHDEFQKLLQTHHLFGSEASVLPLQNLGSLWVFAEQELQHQNSLKVFQERLKQLNLAQSRQMEQLVGLQGTNVL